MKPDSALRHIGLALFHLFILACVCFSLIQLVTFMLGDSSAGRYLSFTVESIGYYVGFRFASTHYRNYCLDHFRFNAKNFRRYTNASVCAVITLFHVLALLAVCTGIFCMGVYGISNVAIGRRIAVASGFVGFFGTIDIIRYNSRLFRVISTSDLDGAFDGVVIDSDDNSPPPAGKDQDSRVPSHVAHPRDLPQGVADANEFESQAILSESCPAEENTPEPDPCGVRSSDLVTEAVFKVLGLIVAGVVITLICRVLLHSSGSSDAAAVKTGLHSGIEAFVKYFILYKTFSIINRCSRDFVASSTNASRSPSFKYVSAFRCFCLTLLQVLALTAAYIGSLFLLVFTLDSSPVAYSIADLALLGTLGGIIMIIIHSRRFYRAAHPRELPQGVADADEFEHRNDKITLPDKHSAPRAESQPAPVEPEPVRSDPRPADNPYSSITRILEKRRE